MNIIVKLFKNFHKKNASLDARIWFQRILLEKKFFNKI